MSALVSTIGLVFINETTFYGGGLPGIFLHETALTPGAGRMDGQAQVSASGSLRKMAAAQMDGLAQVSAFSVFTLAGVVQMDGQAQVLADGIARSVGAVRMDGQAQVAAASANMAVGAAQMDGRTSMVVAQSVPGAGLAEITGAASMVAVAPHVYKIGIFENFVSSDATSLLNNYRFIMLEHLIGGEIMKETVRYRLISRETVNLISTSSYKMKFSRVLREIAITLTDSSESHSRYSYVFTTPISVHSALVPGWTGVLHLVQNLIIGQTISPKFIWGRILKEVFKISAAAGAIGTYKKSLAQLFKFAETFALRRHLILNEHISLSSSSFLAVSMKLLQKLLVASTVSPKLNYHLKLFAEIVIGDILGHYHFAAMLLAELFTIQPVLSRQFIADQSLAQVLTVHPAFNNKLILKIVGNIQLSPSQLVHAIYAGDALLDGVVIQALYISPSGTTTTWAVNTRTNAVTEYMNYDFRSFAQMGSRYIAAGADGLYELDGDTDDGASIIAEMMSGYLQLNDKKLFGIKGAYVAIRGGGRFYLKLIAGDGREYIYELRAQPNLMTTKVRVGKGISTSYVAFDLVTEGQDFDLDSIEFIPMVRGRRV